MRTFRPDFSPFPVKPFCCCLFVLLLSGCSVYHKLFHPYRLPTPKPSPEFLAQQKAKKTKTGFLSFRRSSKQGERLGGTPGAGAEAATDVSTPAGGAVGTPAATPQPARALPERSTVRYDQNGLMKKPKLLRRRVHKPAKPFLPGQAIRNFFKFKRHAKPNYSPDHRPAPKPARDVPADAPPAAPAAVPAPGKP